MLALCSIPDLKLVPAEVTALPAVREYSYRLAPNWYVSPNFDSVQMLHDFAQQLNGGGGSVEQNYVYLDHKSALDWIQLCNTPSYVAAFRESMPHSAIAKRLREVVGRQSCNNKIPYCPSRFLKAINAGWQVRFSATAMIFKPFHFQSGLIAIGRCLAATGFG